MPWACGSPRILLHTDLESGPTAGVLDHAVERSALAHECDRLTRGAALQGDCAPVCNDDPRIVALPPRGISPSPPCPDQPVRRVILDLEHHVARHAIAAATVGAAGRPEPSIPGSDEVGR